MWCHFRKHFPDVARLDWWLHRRVGCGLGIERVSTTWADSRREDRCHAGLSNVFLSATAI